MTQTTKQKTKYEISLLESMLEKIRNLPPQRWQIYPNSYTGQKAEGNNYQHNFSGPDSTKYVIDLKKHPDWHAVYSTDRGAPVYDLQIFQDKSMGMDEDDERTCIVLTGEKRPNEACLMVSEKVAAELYRVVDEKGRVYVAECDARRKEEELKAEGRILEAKRIKNINSLLDHLKA